MEKAEEKAQLFLSLLQHPKIKDSRNKGLMMAFVLDDFDTLKSVIDKAIKKGVITDWFLFCDNSMRVAPPLTITNQEIEKACARILEALEN